MVKNKPAKQAASTPWAERFHPPLPPPHMEMVTHSSTLVWEVPWTEETGRLARIHGLAKV